MTIRGSILHRDHYGSFLISKRNLEAMKHVFLETDQLESDHLRIWLYADLKATIEDDFNILFKALEDCTNFPHIQNRIAHLSNSLDALYYYVRRIYNNEPLTSSPGDSISSKTRQCKPNVERLSGKPTFKNRKP